MTLTGVVVVVDRRANASGRDSLAAEREDEDEPLSAAVVDGVDHAGYGSAERTLCLLPLGGPTAPPRGRRPAPSAFA